MEIKRAVSSNRHEILNVHKQAFGEEKGNTISALVDSLLDDPTAQPSFSFVAIDDGMVIGHVLFTRTEVQGGTLGLSAQILAPLAVQPEHHNKGIGSQLITTGLHEISKEGVQLVFVLGHPGYYPRYGFVPAGKFGFEAPFPIPPIHAEAWMVQELMPGIIGNQRGKILCAASLNSPEHWRE